MALSKETADQVVAAVVADPECQRIMAGPSLGKVIDASLPDNLRSLARSAKFILEATQLAGSARNLALLLMGGDADDPKFQELVCLGISLVTQQAILKAMSAGKIPGLRACSAAHRVVGTFKVHHQATSVRTEDDNWYVFDWHATLNPGNPAINTEAGWLGGNAGFNYQALGGFRGIN